MCGFDSSIFTTLFGFFFLFNTSFVLIRFADICDMHPDIKIPREQWSTIKELLHYEGMHCTTCVPFMLGNATNNLSARLQDLWVFWQEAIR